MRKANDLERKIYQGLVKNFILILEETLKARISSLISNRDNVSGVVYIDSCYGEELEVVATVPFANWPFPLTTDLFHPKTGDFVVQVYHEEGGQLKEYKNFSIGNPSLYEDAGAWVVDQLC